MSSTLFVETTITPTVGRFVSEAREQFLVTDSTAKRGGKAQAWLAGELLLAALGTCAVSSVTAFARERDYPLQDASASASSERHETDETRYQLITLRVVTQGVSNAQAIELVQMFTQNCPVFGTTSRGSPMEVYVNGERLILE